MRYFIADTHFGDSRIMKYEHRPFDTVEEMDNTIIENWNTVVKNDDTVYLLGDIGNIDKIPLLKGNIIIVLGNHDDYTVLDRRFNFQSSRIYISKYPIIVDYMLLSHEPIGFIPPEFPYMNIHGHLHNFKYTKANTDITWDSGNRYFCCSVEQINYTPISFDEIIKLIKF